MTDENRRDIAPKTSAEHSPTVVLIPKALQWPLAGVALFAWCTGWLKSKPRSKKDAEVAKPLKIPVIPDFEE